MINAAVLWFHENSFLSANPCKKARNPVYFRNTPYPKFDEKERVSVMKCCFLLQRQFAYIGHYLAKELKEKHGIEDFCGYVYLRSSYRFLKDQKDISYSTLLLDQDIHETWREEKIDIAYLKDLENRIGLPNMWPYLIADRVIMQEQLQREYPHDHLRYTHEELLKMLQVRAKAIDEMMKKERPDIVFGIQPGGLGSMLLYHIARSYGARTMYVVPSNLQNRYLLSEDYTTFTSVDTAVREQADELLSSEDGAWARGHLEAFRKKPVPNFEKTTPIHQPVTRTQQLGFLKPWRAYRALSEITRTIVHHVKNEDRRDYDYIHPFWQNVDLLKRKLRNLRGNNDLYDRFEPSESFAFFPLHYEPELSLLVLAPQFTDQIHLIGQIARALPVGMTLCVKEHPAMAQYRPRAFYKQIKKIPNIKLLSPTLSGFDVTPHAKLVTTITGTVGWEACLFGVPVISFGRQNFNALTNVTHCTDIEKLSHVIRERLNEKRYDEKNVLVYLAALHRHSFEIDLKQLWEEETDQGKRRQGIAPLANALAFAIKS